MPTGSARTHIQAFSALDQLRPWLLRAIAVLCGLVIPLLFIGRGAVAILVPVIGGMTVCAVVWPDLWRRALAWRHDAVALSIAAMMAVWLVSAAGSIKPGFSLAIWLQVAGLILLAATLPQVMAEGPANLDWALRVLIIVSVAGGLVATISIFLWPPLLSYVRPVDTQFSYAAALRLKSYAAVMPCLAPIILWAGARLGRPWLILAVLSVALGALLVYGAHNRAALGGYFGAGAILLLASAIRRLPASLGYALVALLAAVAVALVAYVIRNLPSMPFAGLQQLQLPQWLVDGHRQVIWGFVWDRALERPWFGWGLSTANFVPGANDSIPGIGQTFVPLHAHNWLLQLMCDVGVTGTMAALAALALFVRKLLRRTAALGAPSAAALALTGAFFVSTLANFSIWQSWWQSVFVILLSIALAGSAVDARAASTRGGSAAPSAAG